MNLYEESRSSPSSDVSDSSENEGEPDISCSHSEISDVNEQDGVEDIFGLLYRQADEEMLDTSKALNQTTGKVRSPIEDHDESNSQSNEEVADDQSIFPEFWLGFNSYEQEPTDKDLSKTDSDDRNDSCQEKDQSSLLEPNIVFYQQAQLGKVLDDLMPTDDSGSMSRILPSATLSKVDSDCSKEEVILEQLRVEQASVPAKIFKSPKPPRTLLGKRQRSDIDDELKKLFEESAEFKGMSKNLSSCYTDFKSDLAGKTSPQKSSSDSHLSFSFRPKKRTAKLQDKQDDLIQSEKSHAEIKVNLKPTEPHRSTHSNSSTTDQSDNIDCQPEKPAPK